MRAMTVVVVGSLNVDTFVAVEALPQPGETVKGGEPSIAFGGKGRTRRSPPPWPARKP